MGCIMPDRFSEAPRDFKALGSNRVRGCFGFGVSRFTAIICKSKCSRRLAGGGEYFEPTGGSPPSCLG